MARAWERVDTCPKCKSSRYAEVLGRTKRGEVECRGEVLGVCESS